MTPWLEWLATASAGFFAGAALYVSMVEHPARMQAGVAVALAEFRPSYKRAAPVQASAAAICLVSSVSVSLLTWEWAWALGGLLVGAAIPFTLLAVMPVNRQLLDTTAMLPEDRAASLLARWGRLHWVRSVSSTGGFVVLLCKVFFGGKRFV
jgi:hypothetical protein